MSIWPIGKDSDAGRDWGQGEKGTTEDEMAGWYHQLDAHEFEWTPGVGDGQGGLACCDSWGHKESDTTERLNWTETNLYTLLPPAPGNHNSTLCYTWVWILWWEHKRCQLCQTRTLFDPIGYSPQDSSVHGILQARMLEWASIPLSRGSSLLWEIEPGSPTLQADSLPSEPTGMPVESYRRCFLATCLFHLA